MSKDIAKLVVKMKSKSLIDIEATGDGANQVFMAAVAVAHTVADGGKGNRKKAEAILTVAKDIIDSVFETVWKSEYGDTPAASEPTVKTETQEDPAAAQPGDMDSMMEKIIADAMKQAKENPGQVQGVMLKVPAGEDASMEDIVQNIIKAVRKQARNGG